jgi:hypothetical protein
LNRVIGSVQSLPPNESEKKELSFNQQVVAAYLSLNNTFKLSRKVIVVNKEGSSGVRSVVRLTGV